MRTLFHHKSANRRRFGTATLLALATVAGSCVTSLAFGQDSEFAGLIRGESSDRGTYQPPILQRAETATEAQPVADWVEPTIVPQRVRTVGDAENAAGGKRPHAQVGYSNAPIYEYEEQYHHAGHGLHAGHGHHGGPRLFEAGCGIEPLCGLEPACGADGGCDSFYSGCDGCGGGGRGKMGGFGICADPSQWFGSVELMLMFRSGDTLPILATTATGTGNAALPGVPANTTRVLFGGERMYDDMTPGGRFTISTWLDRHHCRSLVFRGWGAGQETFSYHTDSSQNPIIGRPFLNVSTGAPNPPNDSLLIASPTLNRTGSLGIRGSSEVYGGDLALRHLWVSGLGGSIEVLYGYQHMRLNEDLDISSTTFDSTNNLVLGVRDYFRADNEFHGGEVGLAARYREGCWSFNGLIKIAAGSVRRTAMLEGSTSGIPDNGGLLVRASNEGEFRNSTFGWVPELDATLGYRYTRNLDFTIGYHLIAMTDALQVSGMIDPNLAVNTGFPATGPARPAANLRFDTFHVQGIHFGLQLVF